MRLAIVALLLSILRAWATQGEEAGDNATSVSPRDTSAKSCATAIYEELAAAGALILMMTCSKYRHVFRRMSHKVNNTWKRSPIADRDARWDKQGDAHARGKYQPRQVAELYEDPAIADDIAEFTKHLIRIEENDGTLSKSDYCSAIQYLAKWGEAETAHQWLRRAIEVDKVPSRSTFGAVINAYAQKGQIARVLVVVGEMKRAGLEVDTITYNMVIGAWGRAGNPAAAQLWMKKMLLAGYSPSMISFGIILKVCAEAGLVEDLEWWYTQSQNFNVKLSLQSFGAVVKAFATAGDVAQAMAWIARMMQHGVQPDIQCFMLVLRPVLNFGDLDMAARLIECMRGADVQLDAGVFGKCVMAAINAGDRGRALDWAAECVAIKLRLPHSVEIAMAQQKMKIPRFRRIRHTRKDECTDLDQEPIEEDACVTKDCATGAAFRQYPENQNMEDQNFEDRLGCIGKRFKGFVKCYVPEKYGFIKNNELYEFFKRDVYLCEKDFPPLIVEGLPVSFILRVDNGGDHARASDLRLEPPSPTTDG